MIYSNSCISSEVIDYSSEFIQSGIIHIFINIVNICRSASHRDKHIVMYVGVSGHRLTLAEQEVNPFQF